MRVGLFPGQGVSAATVSEVLSEDAPFVAEATEIMGYDLPSRVASFAQRDESMPTSLAQPAIFVASLISWWRAQEAGSSFDYLAGHSLGEYPALVASGSIAPKDALRGVKVRAGATDETARSVGGGMAAVMKLDLDEVERIAGAAQLWVANDNAPGQVVLSGDRRALDEAARAVETAGGRWTDLDVSGPFHSPAMEADAPPLEAALQGVDIKPPRIPVISNVTARPHGSPDEIRELLVRQLTHRVRFRESLEWMWGQGVREYEDLGPGEVAAGLARRTFRELESSEVVASV